MLHITIHKSELLLKNLLAGMYGKSNAVHGESATQEYSFVEELSVTIGSSPDNVISLPFGSVAKHHCCIFCVKQDLVIKDMYSSVGTFFQNVLGQWEKVGMGEKHIFKNADTIVVAVGAYTLHTTIQ